MAVISAKKITDALAKARDIGVTEEPLTICDATIVLRNLRPDEYTAVYEDNKEREGLDSLYSFQKGHLCRSIVEINGVDLREADFVEVEEEVIDPKTQEAVIDPQTNEPKVKKIRLERHDFIRRYLLDKWTKEPLYVAWRKFGDVVKLAEDKSQAGVKFILPEMTPEEKLRDAIGNIQEVMNEVPAAIVEAVLEEAGLMRISTANEIKQAMEKTGLEQLAREQAEAAAAETADTVAVREGAEAIRGQAPQTPPASQAPLPQGQLVGAPPTGPRVRQATPEEIMARRNPLNRVAVDVPNPTVQPTIASPQTVVQAPHHAPPGPPLPPPILAPKRSQNIAQMEENLEIPIPPPGDPNLPLRHLAPGAAPQGAAPTHAPNAPHLRTGVPPEAAVLSQKGREKVDMQAFDKIVNRPPVAGINPRFRPAR